jgi:hypothetical protein
MQICVGKNGTYETRGRRKILYYRNQWEEFPNDGSGVDLGLFIRALMYAPRKI